MSRRRLTSLVVPVAVLVGLSLGMTTLGGSALAARGGSGAARPGSSGGSAPTGTARPVLAAVPYMGWNTYYGVGGIFDEQTIISVANSLLHRGLARAAAYRIVWLDFRLGLEAASGTAAASSWSTATSGRTACSG